MKLPEIGAPAPAFTLASTSGQRVSLAEYSGRSAVLLAFFPLAFTSTCTAEVCAFSEDFDRFASADVTVLPVSVDSTDTLREYKRKHALRLDMLSDFKRDASRAYGVLNDERFFANRSYFLIDRHGVLRWRHVEANNGQRREDSELFAVIAAHGSSPSGA
ncbi:MAG: redoxin domain-containing protein [Gemmatimonadetes bacterium]|nr:redoxin domain-containing protein [Gemmatimonadota bacterium]